MMRLYGSKLLLLGTAAILLGGCGGGGGGGSGDETDPPRAVNDTATTQEDNPVTIDVTANDTLTNSDETIDKTSVAIKIQPAHGSAAVQTDGSGKVVYTPDANYYGSDSFTYTVKDNEGEESNVATVTITVKAVNDPPSFSSTPITTATEGQKYSYRVTATDPDSGDTLTITAPTKPSWLTLADNGNGTATLSGTPDDGNDADVVLRVSDGTASADQSFTISVTATASGNKWDKAQWDKGHWAP